jgi:hypothetical protein
LNVLVACPKAMPVLNNTNNTAAHLATGAHNRIANLLNAGTPGERRTSGGRPGREFARDDQ